MERKRKPFAVLRSFQMMRFVGLKSASCSLRDRHFEHYFCHMFHQKDAVTLDSLKEKILPDSAITKVEDVFQKYPKVSFPAFYEKLFSNGCEIYVSKLEKDNVAKNAKLGDVFRIYGKDGFFALGEARKYENGIAIKQIKRF
jgi:tRNA U55 pseudouridine synthase TruB